MEINSEPAFIEEIVQDVEIQLTYGQFVGHTLRGGDQLRDLDSVLLLRRESGEEIRIFKSQILWYGTKTRTIKTPTGRPSTQSPTSPARPPSEL